MKNTENKSIVYIYILMIYEFIFQDFLQKHIYFFKYFDEMVAVMLIPIGINWIIKHKENLKIKKYNFYIIIFLIIIFLIGFYANIKYNYQQIKYVLADVILVYKFFMTYFLASIIFKNKLDNSNLIVKYIKLLILFMFFGTLIDYIYGINLGSYYRWGIHPNQFIYGHPTGLAAMGVIILANYIKFAKKIIDKYSLMILIVIASTLRMKAIGFCVAFIIMAIYITTINKQIKVSKLIILAIIVFIVAYQQIAVYFINSEDTARQKLLEKSLEIAKDYFPIGTGFATYGSYFSGVSYSPIYNIYGLDKVYGLAKDKTYFISDSFWPMIIGQFGIISTILYVICIILIYKKIQYEYSKDNNYQYLSRLMCLVYLLISSTAESAFVNTIAVPLAILIAV